MEPLKIWLFGTPRLAHNGTPINIGRRKAIGLLAYLSLVNKPQSRDVIMALLWPELDQEHSGSALRSTLHSLTLQLPEDCLEVTRQTLYLNSETAWVDVGQFQSLQRQQRLHSHNTDVLCENCV